MLVIRFWISDCFVPFGRRIIQVETPLGFCHNLYNLHLGAHKVRLLFYDVVASDILLQAILMYFNSTSVQNQSFYFYFNFTSDKIQSFYFGFTAVKANHFTSTSTSPAAIYHWPITMVKNYGRYNFTDKICRNVSGNKSLPMSKIIVGKVC